MLTVTEMLRKKGVVDKFVEFFGDGLANLPLADRATIANMAPEYGSTCGIFPIDEETLRYLELSGRTARAGGAGRRLRQGAGPVAHRGRDARPRYTDVLELDLGKVEPSSRRPAPPAGPRAAEDCARAVYASRGRRRPPRSAAQRNPRRPRRRAR